MTKNIFLSACMVVFAMIAQAQDKQFPTVNVKSLEGQSISTKDIVKENKIYIYSFWATWCSPCKKELDAMLDIYEDWQKEYNVELVAVSVDDSRTVTKVKPMVAEKGWPYTVIIDPTKELQVAAGVSNVPHTFLVDAKGNIVYEHTGYAPGDEFELEKKIKELAQK